jgi:hypothetical protein
MGNIVDRLRKHWLGGIVILVTFVATTTYQLINVLFIEPKNQEIQRQDKIIRELKEKIDNLEKDLAKIKTKSPEVKLPIPKSEKSIQENKEQRKQPGSLNEVELCKEKGAQKITIDHTSLILSIADFWEKGTEVSLIVRGPPSDVKQTKIMKVGDTENIVLSTASYTLSIIYVKEPCIKFSIEKLRRNKS